MYSLLVRIGRDGLGVWTALNNIRSLSSHYVLCCRYTFSIVYTSKDKKDEERRK